MAHNKNLKKSEGMCQKIHNAVMNPFRPRIRSTSHHQPQGSISITSNKKPASRNTPPVPVRAELEPLAEREVEIVGSRETIAKSYTKKEKLSQRKNDGDDLLHGKEFSGYVGKVDRVMKTASSVGGSGGGGGEASLTGDSFNDRITNYINRAKSRMRKTTSVGDDGRSSSLK